MIHASKTIDWTCPRCRYYNYASREQCHRCEAHKTERHFKGPLAGSTNPNIALTGSGIVHHPRTSSDSGESSYDVLRDIHSISPLPIEDYPAVTTASQSLHTIVPPEFSRNVSIPLSTTPIPPIPILPQAQPSHLNHQGIPYHPAYGYMYFNNDPYSLPQYLYAQSVPFVSPYPQQQAHLVFPSYVGDLRPPPYQQQQQHQHRPYQQQYHEHQQHQQHSRPHHQ